MDELLLRDGADWVRLRADAPVPLAYGSGERELAAPGTPWGDTLVDGVACPTTVRPAGASGASARWQVELPEQGASFGVEAQLADGTFTWRLTDLVDPRGAVHRLEWPELWFASFPATATVLSTTLSTDRARSGDTTEVVGDTEPGTARGSWLLVGHVGPTAVAFDTNAIDDNSVPGIEERRPCHDERWQRQVRPGRDGVELVVRPGVFTWRGTTADAIGLDADPFVRVRLAGDENGDGIVDWQDAALALRALRNPGNGGAETACRPVMRIAFNIVSQATHPFLRTLDDTKRVALATDGLGQRVMLKGYQAEGHDCAHPDYAGHYNERAGGLADLTTLVTVGERWNATFGVHVNATESYSEAHALDDDLLRQPPSPAWNWMNQSYRIDGPKDLGSGRILERLAAFRREVPANLSWLYFDVYYPFGWEAERLCAEVQRQGWTISTEWSDRFPTSSVWSHWATDEKYGGQDRKGINSRLMRFVENHWRDVFNPDPLLGNASIVEFEGWTHQHDWNAFLANVWDRNVPAKFMQRSPIVSWVDGRVELADGTVAESDVAHVEGDEVGSARTITCDGVVVYRDGAYLLPWHDGPERLYHRNLTGGSTTWELGPEWRDEAVLEAYRLGDTGRVRLDDVPVAQGHVTLAVAVGETLVLYRPGTAPAVPDPAWGEGSQLSDPGFYSGTTAGWQTEGDVRVESLPTGDRVAVLGSGPAALAQDLTLPAGTYAASAWVEIEGGQRRPVTLALGEAATSVEVSPARNATASDDKFGTRFQRLRVVADVATAPVRLAISAGEGSALVRLDDVRVVATQRPVDPAPTPATILFEDFEHVDQGYWPFVTGPAGSKGDARTQLAEDHPPYSRRGWWGVVEAADTHRGVAGEGAKLVDNVLAGDWSLLLHEEREGLVLRTTPASLALRHGSRYRVSFLYQASFDGQYALVVGRDTESGEVIEERWELGATDGTATFVAEFVVGDPSPWFLGVVAGEHRPQADLVLDDLRVEDLGAPGEGV